VAGLQTQISSNATASSAADAALQAEIDALELALANIQLTPGPGSGVTVSDLGTFSSNQCKVVGSMSVQRIGMSGNYDVHVSSTSCSGADYSFDYNSPVWVGNTMFFVKTDGRPGTMTVSP